MFSVSIVHCLYSKGRKRDAVFLRSERGTFLSNWYTKGQGVGPRGREEEGGGGWGDPPQTKLCLWPGSLLNLNSKGPTLF